MKKQLKNYIMTVCFLLFIFGFAVASFISEDREFSENENRYLQQAPEFSWKKLEKGEFTSDIESYMSDQIFMKDQLVSLKTVTDRTLLKNYQNGVYFGKDGYYLQDYQENRPLIEKNISCLNDFADSLDKSVDVSFLLVPNAVSVMSDKLPAVTQTDDQLESEKYISSILSDRINLCFPYDQLKDAAKSTQVFYKTDHHWTPDGAYRAYQQFCTLKNLTPFDCNVYTKITVPDFYGTHYSATRRWNAQADSFSYYDLPNQMTVYKVNGEADYEPVKTEGLMNLAKLDTRDKYGAFLDGNNGYSVIEGNGTGSILVVKDSYANSFIPYLTANYAKIGVVDFRGLAYGLDSTIEKEGYDQILILYNFQTFISDNKVIYLDRPTTLK